ncbi:MAG: PAS domain S-box protein [Gallionellaceae bacterium]
MKFERQHRGLAVGIRNEVINKKLQEAHHASKEDAVLAMRKVELMLPRKLSSGDAWQGIKNKWEVIHHASNNWQPKASFDVHTQLIEELFFFTERVADEYKLTFGRDVSLNYLTRAAIEALPLELEQMTQLRAMGLRVLVGRHISEQQKIEIHEHLARFSDSFGGVSVDLKRAMRYKPGLEKQLKNEISSLNHSAQDFVELIEVAVLKGEYMMSPVEFYSLSTAMIDRSYQEIFQNLLPESESVLKDSIRLDKYELYGYATFVAILLLLAHYLLFGIFFSVRSNLKLLMASAQKFSMGDMTERIHIDARDEFFQIGECFNKVADGFNAALLRQMESEKLWHFAIEGSGDGVWEWNVQSNEVGFSKRWKEMLGYAEDEVQDDFQWWTDNLHPEDIADVLNNKIQPFLDGLETHYVAEFRMRCKDGSYKWILARAMSTDRQNGTPRRVVGTHSDITERKNMEEYLRQSEQQAHAYAKELDLQKYALDQHAIVATTDVTGRITYVNELFCKISGYERNELIGQDYSMLNSGYHPHGFFKEMYRIIASGNIWTEDVCNRTKNGELYWMHTTVAPEIGLGGKPVRYIAVHTDITERKQAEDLAQAANHAKSEFLANMSHEIRTPMNGVIGMADVLQQTNLTSEQQRMVRTIHDSSLSLLTILNDILDLSKIEAGKLQLEHIPTSLREVVEGVAQLMFDSANEKSVELSVFVSPKLPKWILSDPTRLRQILLNLLGNAVKFTSGVRGRPAYIALRAEAFDFPDGRPGVSLRIIDNGIGMSLETQEKLFQPFTQADASTSRKFGGTGLGLSITQRLLELMGGRITLSSTLGQGSEFRIEMPLQEAAADEKQTAEPDLSGVRVLIVNDDAEKSECLSIYCGAVGAETMLVPDMLAARAQLQQIPPASSSSPLIVLCSVDAVSDRELKLPDAVQIVQLVLRGRSILASKAVPVHARPMLYYDLIYGLALASGRMSASDRAALAERRQRPRIHAPTITQALASKQLILMAEDNETNREVMREQLRLLGYAVEMAEDGVVALDMWRSGRYALLLSDCHMPNMDGFELTAAIRREEAPGTHLPIVAVTANALQGESERCIAQGMDGYLSKPLRLDKLGAMLARWLPLPEQSAEDRVASQDSESRLIKSDVSDFLVWDASTLTQMVGDNPEMHQRLLRKFLVNARVQVDAIVAAASEEDIATAGKLAHTLKSSARTVGAMQLGELCQEIEMAGKAGDTPTCNALNGRLNAAFDAAEEQIQVNLTKQVQ